jgi:hypothetical protein
MMGFRAIGHMGATGRDPCELGHPKNYTTKHRVLFIVAVVIIIIVVVKPWTQNTENHTYKYNTRLKA